MLAYIVIVCNSNVGLMTKTTSNILTWYKEWFFYLEFCWGRALIRWKDAESYKNYGISHDRLIKVFDEKLQIVLRARKSWPLYARHHEDVKLRKGKME